MKVKKLITENEIKKRITELAEEIKSTFGEKSITIISLLKGAFIFTADLARNLKNLESIEFIKVTSYSGTKKQRTEIDFPSSLTFTGKNVLILDDIFDTGETLKLVTEKVENQNPRNVKTCVLLVKEIKRNVDFYPDFVGFKIPDKFVIGYGLDYNELYRELPYIAYLEKEQKDG